MNSLMLPCFCSFDIPPAEAQGELENIAYQMRELDWQSQKIRFYTTGNPDGPILLFIHGSPGGWSAWLEYLKDPQLRQNYFLVALDRPGYGGSGRGQAEGQLQKQASAVERVTEYLRGDFNKNKKQGRWYPEPRDIFVIGHSYGGPVAIRYAMDHPQKPAGLILIASPANPKLEEWTWLNRFADSLIGSWLTPTDWLTSNRELKPLAKELAEISNQYSKIKCPILVLQGMQDSLVPPANVEYLAGRLKHLTGPRLQIITWPEQSHFVIWSEKQMVIKAITSFIEQNNH